MRWQLCIGGALILFAACNNNEDNASDQIRVTRVMVSPDAFLGDVPCDLPGGLLTYQATLFDVTAGLDTAFQLPSSRVVSCHSDVGFEFVEHGRRYIAKIVGFDRDDVAVQNPGSPVIVDADGKSVQPRWATTCWGDDRNIPDFSTGGAGGTGTDGSEGVGGTDALGVEAYYLSQVYVRGCEALSSDLPPASTSVTFDILPSLGNLSCGQDPGNIASFAVVPAGEDIDFPAAGGAGGMSAGGATGVPDDLNQVPCGQTLTLNDQSAGDYLSYTLYAFEANASIPSWTATCEARPVAGGTVASACTPLKPLP